MVCDFEGICLDMVELKDEKKFGFFIVFWNSRVNVSKSLYLDFLLGEKNKVLFF